MFGRRKLRQKMFMQELGRRMNEYRDLTLGVLQADPRSEIDATDVDATGAYYRSAAELLGAFRAFNAAYDNELIEGETVVRGIVDNLHKAIFEETTD